jgi:SNF2 family DNA or RNA helicase
MALKLEDEPNSHCIFLRQGLGKTLTAIALLHTVLTHPSMISSQNDKKILRTVVLVVPVNTLANWAEEFTKWLEYVSPKLCVYTPFNMEIQARHTLIDKWMATGGIFLVSKDTLPNLAVVNGKETDLLHADILVLDEAHSMIKNPSTQIFTALSKFATKRRILLSGSPFQNNLEEYYHICNFIRDGVFGALQQFRKEFIDPILQGQVKDSTRHQKALIAARSADLRKLVDAHVHRKDLSVLENDLPKLSQVVLHVRPSHIQSKIYRTFEKARKSNPELRGFFKMYSELSPVHNHPSCLLKYSAVEGMNKMTSKIWCRKHLTLQSEAEELEKITGGNKIVLLLHLLAYAEVLGEKVLIFSQYLPTLNYIEGVLNSRDWISQVPSLSCFSGQRLGEWEKGRHYLRIDGSSSSAQRGQSINAFNKDGADGDLRAFLISTEAGSLGINLVRSVTDFYSA